MKERIFSSVLLDDAQGAENRITDAYTTDRKALMGIAGLEEHDAFYQYYKHGPLAKTIIGQRQVQGVDYAYTVQGWLKGVNSDSLLDDDGKTGSIVGKDAYRFSLNYFNGDYAAISASLANAFPGFFRPVSPAAPPVTVPPMSAE